MKLREEINPGVCGFPTVVTATSDDGRHVTIDVTSGCDIMQELDRQIGEISPVDAIAALGPHENPIMARSRELLCTTGCCEACVVPVGIVKAMYVVSNLALARDVTLTLTGAAAQAQSDDGAV